MRPDTMYQHIFVPIEDNIGFVNCTNVTLLGCNKVFNPELSTNGNYNSDPWLVFNNDYIDYWGNSHGTPNIETTANSPGAPPFPGTHGAWMEFSPVAGGEGITGKIKPLTPFKPYSLSFFQTMISVSASLNEYNIYLVHCSDAPLYFNPMSYSTPTPPPHSQQIYCQTNFPVLAGWNQVAINFTPNENYDMIWVFPKESNIITSGNLYIGFGYPEIIDNETFSAGPPPSPTPGNCIVTIGPTTPNCGVKNAVYTWYDPTGQPHPANIPDQKLNNVNTSPGSSDIGVWILEMTVPTTILGNNYCSSSLYAQATVNVPSCIPPPPCTTPPTISPSGTISVCSYWEPNPTNPAILTTNITNYIQWYRNGIIIPGATSQTYYAYADGGQGSAVKTYSYTVKNTNGNCESSPVVVNFVPYPDIFFTSECRNSPIPITTTDYGSNASYSWTIPGGIITPNSTSRQIQVTFPGTYTNSFFEVYLTATNSYGCNGSNYRKLNFNTSCRLTTEESNFLPPKKALIYPNPANSQITITSKEIITSIEISDLLNLTSKIIKVNGTNSVTININDLSPGVYSCKIATVKGVENQKLIIKR